MTQHCLLTVNHGTSSTAAASQPHLQIFFLIQYNMVAITNPFICPSLRSLNCVLIIEGTEIFNCQFQLNQECFSLFLIVTGSKD